MEFPKLLDTEYERGMPGAWMFHFDNPDTFNNVQQHNYLAMTWPTILPTGEWTHIYCRANKYGQYFEQQEVDFECPIKRAPDRDIFS